MVELKNAHKSDVEALTEIQIRTFVDNNKLKPPGWSGIEYELICG